jgi:hypothetical protein
MTLNEKVFWGKNTKNLFPYSKVMGVKNKQNLFQYSFSFFTDSG